MHSFHLLLVDDHENIRFTFRHALVSDGYEVDTAATVSEAQAKIEARRYDVLILDLRLGVESSLTLLTRLREDRINTPAIMVSAHGSTEEAVSAMKLGAVDFLAKPLEPVRLRVAVAEVFRHRLPSNDDTTSSSREAYERQILEARHALNCRDLGAARLYLARALELNSHSADAHYLFGSMLDLSNHPDTAKRYYNRALQLYAERSLALASLPAPGSLGADTAR